MMILQEEVEKKKDAALSSSKRPETIGKAGDDGVRKMWIERVSDIYI